MRTKNPMRCPNCSEAMEQQSLERYDGGALAIDLCFRCHLLWFDFMESPQLAAGAVIDLLKLIRRHAQEQRQVLRERLNCPHCGSPLVRTDDLVKSGHIRYYRCAQDGGRLTPFLQFLIEKQFVRAVTSREISRLRLSIGQARCSGCGAPIDLARQDRCEHCHAAITVLDADAFERAAREWGARARQRASARAKAEEAIARLRDVDQWECKDCSDLFLHSLGIVGT